MNKNITPIILLILAIGIYFTFTRDKIDELKAIQAVNEQYRLALENSEKLIQVRDEVLQNYNSIDVSDRERLDKMLPDNVDNVRLIIDVNGVAARHGLAIRNVKTATPESNDNNISSGDVADEQYGINVPESYEAMTLSFDVNSTYQNFVNFLRDLEASLRIIDVSKIELTASDTGIYNYGVELKTYWLK